LTRQGGTEFSTCLVTVNAPRRTSDYLTCPRGSLLCSVAVIVPPSQGGTAAWRPPARGGGATPTVYATGSGPGYPTTSLCRPPVTRPPRLARTPRAPEAWAVTVISTAGRRRERVHLLYPAPPGCPSPRFSSQPGGSSHPPVAYRAVRLPFLLVRRHRMRNGVGKPVTGLWHSFGVGLRIPRARWSGPPSPAMPPCALSS
jgi:hypothetical protein